MGALAPAGICPLLPRQMPVPPPCHSPHQFWHNSFNTTRSLHPCLSPFAAATAAETSALMRKHFEWLFTSFTTDHACHCKLMISRQQHWQFEHRQPQHLMRSRLSLWQDSRPAVDDGHVETCDHRMQVPRCRTAAIEQCCNFESALTECSTLAAPQLL